MRWPYMVLTGLYCAGIFYMSSKQEPVPANYDFEGLDKLVHIVVYGGLAAVVSVGIRRADRPASLVTQAFVPVGFAALYGLTDEIHQWFIPHRNFDPLDLLANMAGAFFVQAALLRWWGIRLRAAPSPGETTRKLPG